MSVSGNDGWVEHVGLILVRVSALSLRHSGRTENLTTRPMYLSVNPYGLLHNDTAYTLP